MKLFSHYRGPSMINEFLDPHGEGVDHVAHDCGGRPWEQRMSWVEERRFQMVQGGSWQAI